MPTPRARRLVAAVLACLVVAAVAACGGASKIARRGVVPNVIGKRLPAAEAALSADGFVVGGVVSGRSVTAFGPDTIAARIAKEFPSKAEVDRWVVCGTHPRVGRAAASFATGKRGALRYGVTLDAARSCPTA